MRLLLSLILMCLSELSFASQYTLNISDHWMVSVGSSEAIAKNNLKAEEINMEKAFRDIYNDGSARAFFQSYQCTSERRCQASGGQYYCGCLASLKIIYNSTSAAKMERFTMEGSPSPDYLKAYESFRNKCFSYIYNSYRSDNHVVGATCGLPTAVSSSPFQFRSVEGKKYFRD